jgi:hypothetical protein
MGLRENLNVAHDHDHAHAHPLVHTVAAALIVAVAPACGAGYRVTTATAVTGAAASKMAIVVNARHCGAKGDGRNNDSQAIQRAIDTAATRNGGTVYLPRGFYYCPTGIRLSSHVNLRGDGRSASWLMGYLDFGSRCTVSRLKIGAPGVSAAGNLGGPTTPHFSAAAFAAAAPDTTTPSSRWEAARARRAASTT